jgi:uncharacterized protein
MKWWLGRSRFAFVVSSLLLGVLLVTDPGCVTSSTKTTKGHKKGGSGAGGSEGSRPDANFDRQALLNHMGTHVLFPATKRFLQRSTELKVAVEKYVISNSSSDRQAARQAWKVAASETQELEVFQVGPAGLMGEVLGGQSIRDEIYSWPLTNACRVDQELVEQAYLDPTAFSKESINVRGMDALEYLLFSESKENSCPIQNTINASGAWAALSLEELGLRRAVYAQTLARDLEKHAQRLVDGWDPNKGNFLTSFTQAGKGSAVYATSQEALNAVSDAMFYLEKEAKDMKLAIPAGISGCIQTTCPQNLESRYAKHSKHHVISNLKAFRRLYFGGDSATGTELGFDDWLVALGAEQLANDLKQKIAEAFLALEAIEEEDLAEALNNDLPSVHKAYQALKALVVLMKTEMISVLDLEIPNRAEGDND